MMMQRVAVFLVVSFLATSLGQDVSPCLRTRESCSYGMSSVSVINNNYFCCAPGGSMSFVNNRCSCTKTSRVQPCDVGRYACRYANSFSSNGNGDYRCCQPGFSMSSFSSFVNGRQISSCTCSSGGGGGGNMFISSGDPNFNGTEFGNRMNRWGQEFSRQMANMQNNLQQSLGNMFRNMGNGFFGR